MQSIIRGCGGEGLQSTVTNTAQWDYALDIDSLWSIMFEPPVEPARDGAGGKILFTGGKTAAYELDVDVSELDKELAEFENKWAS